MNDYIKYGLIGAAVLAVGVLIGALIVQNGQLGIGQTTITGATSQTITNLTVTATSGTNMTTTDFQTVDGVVLDDLTVYGEVNATSIERIVSVKINPTGAVTQTQASFPAPTNGRFYTDFHCDMATSTPTGGSLQFTVSLGTATGTITGTDLFYNNTVNPVTVMNTGHYWTATSTLPGVASSTAGTLAGDNNNPLNTPIRFGPVYSTQGLTLLVNPPTSTITGVCHASYRSAAQVGNN